MILAGSEGAGKSAIFTGLTGKSTGKTSKVSFEGVIDIGTLVLSGLQFIKSKRKDDAILSIWDYQVTETSQTCNRFYLSGALMKSLMTDGASLKANHLIIFVTSLNRTKLSDICHQHC